MHGADAARTAEEVSRLLFGKGDPAALSASALDALSREVPFREVEPSVTVIDALVDLKLAASKSAARRLIEQGGVTVNSRRASSASEALGEPLVGGSFLVTKGARDFGLVRLTSR